MRTPTSHPHTFARCQRALFKSKKVRGSRNSNVAVDVFVVSFRRLVRSNNCKARKVQASTDRQTGKHDNERWRPPGRCIRPREFPASKLVNASLLVSQSSGACPL